eukprot:3397528-Ditylum_brightwellii.AAC.1
MHKKITKKTLGSGIAYTAAKKCFWFLMLGFCYLSQSLEGRCMHIAAYSKKNWSVESLWQCFTNLHCTKASSGNPSISQEVKETKMAWLQIQA